MKAFASVYQQGIGWLPEQNIDTADPTQYANFDVSFGPLWRKAAVTAVGQNSFMAMWWLGQANQPSSIYANVWNPVAGP